jgi:hypothetical protein
MFALLRTIHVLVLAVWLGSVVFFTVTGVLLFRAFTTESANEPRPPWFPAPQYKNTAPLEGLPDVREEQGSRLAGVAVSAIFPVYFALQAGCAAVAVLTALGLAWKQRGGLSTVRVVVCILGLAAVLAGWWLQRHVSALRLPRNEHTDAVLQTSQPTAEQIQQARQARADFGMWHGISVLVNFATLGLALVATGLAAHLPAARSG